MGLLNLRLDPIPQLGLQTNEIPEQSDNIETHEPTLPQVDSVESTLAVLPANSAGAHPKGPQSETV